MCIGSCFGEPLSETGTAQTFEYRVIADTSPSLGGHLILEPPEPFRATVSEWMAQSG